MFVTFVQQMFYKQTLFGCCISICELQEGQVVTVVITEVIVTDGEAHARFDS